MAERLQLLLKSQNSRRFWPNQHHQLAPSLYIKCNTNGIHRGIVACLSHIYMKKPAAAALNTPTCLSSPGRAYPEGKLTSYRKVVDYLLLIYVPDDIPSTAELNTLSSKSRSCKRAFQYGQAIWTKDLCWRAVSDNYRLKRLFMKNLKQPILQSVQRYCAKNM